MIDRQILYKVSAPCPLSHLNCCCVSEVLALDFGALLHSLPVGAACFIVHD